MERVGVAGIIARGNTVLVLLRSKSDAFLPGAYDLPGGGLGPGEVPDEGIIREVFEETGLRTSVVRKLGTRNYVLSGSGKNDKALVVYLLQVHGESEVILSREHDEYRWISDPELAAIFRPDDLMRIIIHDYFMTASNH